MDARTKKKLKKELDELTAFLEQKEKEFREQYKEQYARKRELWFLVGPSPCT